MAWTLRCRGPDSRRSGPHDSGDGGDGGRAPARHAGGARGATRHLGVRMRPPGGALVRRLVLFADSTLDTVHTICSRPGSGCAYPSPPV